MTEAATKRDRAPTIWLLHGLGDDWSAWAAMLRTPTPSRHGMVCVDIAGHGGSPPRKPRHLEASACEIGERIARQRRPVVLVGHSMGGVLATLVAEGGWPHVVAVVNVEGNLTPADCMFSGEAAVAKDVPGWISEIRRRMRRSNGRYAKALGRVHADAMQLAARDLVRLSRGELIGRRYAALRVPTLYIGGADVPATTLEFLLANRLDKTLIPGAGHWVMVDQPAETAMAIDRFVSSTT